jgi:hypothetical protein
MFRITALLTCSTLVFSTLISDEAIAGKSRSSSTEAPQASGKHRARSPSPDSKGRKKRPSITPQRNVENQISDDWDTLDGDILPPQTKEEEDKHLQLALKNSLEEASEADEEEATSPRSRQLARRGGPSNDATGGIVPYGTHQKPQSAPHIAGALGGMAAMNRVEIRQNVPRNQMLIESLSTKRAINVLKADVFTPHQPEIALAQALSRASTYFQNLKQQEENFKAAEGLISKVRTSVTWAPQRLTGNMPYYTAYYEDVLKEVGPSTNHLVRQAVLALLAQEYYENAFEKPKGKHAQGTLFGFKSSIFGWSPADTRSQQAIISQLQVSTASGTPTKEEIIKQHYAGAQMRNAWINLNAQIQRMAHDNAALIDYHLNGAKKTTNTLLKMCEKANDFISDDDSYEFLGGADAERVAHAEDLLKSIFQEFANRMNEGLSQLSAESDPSTLAHIMATMTAFIGSATLEEKIEELKENSIGKPWEWEASVMALRAQMDTILTYLSSYQFAVMREHFQIRSLTRQADFYTETLGGEEFAQTEQHRQAYRRPGPALTAGGNPLSRGRQTGSPRDQQRDEANTDDEELTDDDAAHG